MTNRKCTFKKIYRDYISNLIFFLFALFYPELRDTLVICVNAWSIKPDSYTWFILAWSYKTGLVYTTHGRGEMIGTHM